MKLLQKYHKIGAVLCLIIAVLPLSAQNKNTYAYFDSATYKQYLDRDWKNLQRTSEKAFREGIDYYYLRMRAGIAFYRERELHEGRIPV